MAAVYYHFFVTALDKDGKVIFNDENGGDIPLKFFGGFFLDVCKRAAVSGCKTMLTMEYKKNNSSGKETKTYRRKDFDGKSWTAEETITEKQYQALIDG